VFLGYHFQQKGYKLLDIHSHFVFVSRDVIFHESIFPFAIGLTTLSSDGVFLPSPSSSSSPILPNVIPDIPHSSQTQPDSHSSEHHLQFDPPSSQLQSDLQPSDLPSSDPQPISISSLQPSRRSSWVKHKPSYLQ
jgi:hypothetical protein